MTYAEKLKDPRWQKKRLEILQRDGFRCMETGCFSDKKTLHVHHLDYIQGADPWEYPNEYLLTLCVDCHESQTKERKEYEDVLKKQFRLKFKDSFSQSCISTVFSKYENIADIIYFLYELSSNQSQVEDLLKSLWDTKREEFFAKHNLNV